MFGIIAALLIQHLDERVGSVVDEGSHLRKESEVLLLFGEQAESHRMLSTPNQIELQESRQYSRTSAELSIRKLNLILTPWNALSRLVVACGFIVCSNAMFRERALAITRSRTQISNDGAKPFLTGR